jgi:hypothetical protein
MSNPNPGRGTNRTVRVRLTERDKNDPVSLLNAVRNALDGHGIRLRVDRQNTPPTGADVPQTARVQDEQLETKARELAAATLEREAARQRKETIQHDRDAERMAQEIIAARKGLGAIVKYWVGRLVGISVECVETVASHGKEIATRFLGRKE